MALPRLGPRRPSVEMSAPAERLAAFRALSTGFTTLYLLIRSPMFLGLTERSPRDLDPVGVLVWIESPPPALLIEMAFVLTVVTGAAATVGWRYRWTAPVFAVGLLFLTTLRSSWGQLLHFENLMALFAVVLAVAPAADAWSLDARRRGDPSTPRSERHSDRYGHPLVVAAAIMVTTYVIAGIAKLRYGGLGWAGGDTLQNHIASAAARLDLLGGTPAPFAELAVRADVFLPVFAASSVLLELIAPVALWDRRVRDAWVGATWLMHVGILATMAIGFPSPLFGVAFAPLFHLEHLGDRVIGLAHRVSAIRGSSGEELGTTPN